MSPVQTSARLRLRIAVTVLASTLGMFVLVGADTGLAGSSVSGPTTILTPSSETTTAETVATTVVTTTTAFVPTTRSTPTTARPVQSTSATTEATPTSSTIVSETSTTTGRNLLVAGDGTDGAESTTTTSTTPTSASDDGGVSESTTLWLIVAGLVAIAVLIGLWTRRYWVSTRPEPDDGPSIEAGEGTDRPGGDDPTTVF